ncbi:MAG TPA: S8 family serine peptidase [Thermoanaerobaculia bacterium]|nr:S8 family serine peptidase [Thermoanaerobaculia bacterium]
MTTFATFPSETASKRELIVLTAPAGAPAIALETLGPDVNALLETKGARMRPLFGPASGISEEGAPSVVPQTHGLDARRFFYVDAADAELDELAAALRDNGAVSAAYVKPRGEPPTLNAMVASGPPAPAAMTPDFSPRQIYRLAAPAGIDVNAAWSLAGGRGSGVSIIDLEWNWELAHEDLGGVSVVVGSATGNPDHGTAVAGVLVGADNGFGVSGISPDATLRFGAFSIPSAQAIDQAAALLSAGDILLLEIHRAGPRHQFQPRQDQRGYIAIEWWPDDFVAIEAAVRKGIIVVEAAGNGGEDLDDVLYDTPDPGFPAGWTNPFRRTTVDCGAILVGAGAPPPGTHGRSHGRDRSRLSFSNHGSAIDAQGWGREVTTTGYGDLQSGASTVLYTDEFSGTSSASPIIAGALACVQGIRIANGNARLDSWQSRQALRSTGSPQQSATAGAAVTERIGNRPNLNQLIAFSATIP